jgi:ADP-ribose pyrophosphatase YjhB (NUDIX family)
MNNIAPNQPLYLYQQPMFALTVSTVLIVDNGVMLIKDGDVYGFPGGLVRAGQETIQFAAVRYIKEQVGITLKKDALIPVDFRSDPSRSKEGNVVDMGFVCMVEQHFNTELTNNAKWKEVDFEKRKMVESIKFFMDHELLLDRAIEVMTLMK